MRDVIHNSWLIKILVVLALLVAAYLPLAEVNDYSSSDPMGSLLLSESVLVNRSLKLDSYGTEVLGRYGYKVHKKNDHYYYYFPIGSSLASLPFVAVANGLGLNMIESERTIQRYVASATAVITLSGFILLASIFLPLSGALLLSTIYWFGSSLVSTSATALWSHNFAVLFAVYAIYFTIKMLKDGKRYWPAIASLLFFAYLCRPTMALLAPCLIVWVLFNSRRQAINVSILLGLLISLFVLFSFYEFDQPLPDYYLPKRLESGSFWEAVYGNLFSPSRGLFIYSPFIVASWLFYKYSNKEWGIRAPWLWVGLGWPILHLVFVSRFPHWWGGWSYGPRLMMDILPGLFLVSMYTWPSKLTGAVKVPLAFLLFISSLFALAVNTGQGLFNKYTAQWNAYPSVDEFHFYIFDWSYPQFAANPTGHSNRLSSHARYIERFESGEFLKDTPNSINFSHLDSRLRFERWNQPESKHRWSEGNASSIIFQIEDSNPRLEKIKVYVGTFLDKQNVTIRVNGVQAYKGVIRGWYDTIEFNTHSLHGGDNVIEFDLPDARVAGNDDPRVLGLAFKHLQIY